MKIAGCQSLSADLVGMRHGAVWKPDIQSDRRLFYIALPSSVVIHILVAAGFLWWPEIPQPVDIPPTAIEVTFVSLGNNSGGNSAKKSTASPRPKSKVMASSFTEEKQLAMPVLSQSAPQPVKLTVQPVLPPPLTTIPRPRKRPQLSKTAPHITEQIKQPEKTPSALLVRKGREKFMIPGNKTGGSEVQTASATSISVDGQGRPPDEAKSQGKGVGVLPGFKPGSRANPLPKYPSKARRKGLEGRVLLAVEVDKFGKVSRIQVRQSSGSYLLDKVARKAVRKWRFEPARIVGKPVSGQALVPISFKLT